MNPVLQYVYDKHKRRQIRREQLRHIKALKLIEHLKNIQTKKPMEEKKETKNTYLYTALTLALIAAGAFMYLGNTVFSFGFCGIISLGAFISTLIHLYKNS